MDTVLIDGKHKGTFFYGCRAKRFLTLGALGQEAEIYRRNYLQRSLEFISCLISSRDERFTYDLRILSEPDTQFNVRGKITVAIICKAQLKNKTDAQISADHFSHFVESFFEEFDFERLTHDEIRTALRPFDPKHLVSITRRCAWHRLDSISERSTGSSIGFTPKNAKPEMGAEHLRVFHVFPYVCPFSPSNTLFRLLLTQSAPVLLSCRLQPTALQSVEQEFLEQQAFLCEKYAQVAIGGATEDLSPLRPTLRDQARAHQRLLLRMLYELKDAAALLTVELASPAPIPQSVIDTCGHSLTQPAGMVASGKDGNGERFLSGGYEAFELSTDPVALSCFQNLDIHLPSCPEAPTGGQRLPYLFDASQAAMALRFPPASDEPPPGVDMRRWRLLPPPSNLPDAGLHVAKSVAGGAPQPINISAEDRLRHIYIVGQTGTGKTTMLQTMIQSDIRAGQGLCVIDPHGDLFKKVLSCIPKDRLDDVVILDPSDMAFPVGLNVLACRDETDRHCVVQNMVGIIQRLLEDDYGAEASRMSGPIFYQHMRMNLMLVMSDPGRPGTLLDFYRVFMEKNYWKQWVPPKLSDPQLDMWVNNSLPNIGYDKMSSDGFPFGQYYSSKFEEFVFDPRLRNILGQRRSTVDVRKIMDSGKILLVNLAKGELSAVASRFLGMLVLAEIQRAAMSRVDTPMEKRRLFSVYVDEFQHLATLNFVSMLSEGRKFGLGLVLANQFIGQVEERRIVNSIFGNVGTLICFRLGQVDAEFVERYVKPAFSQSDLTNLPNWISTMSTLVGGQTVQPFSVETTLMHTPINQQQIDDVRKRSRDQYAHPRAIVETDLGYSKKEGSG